MCLLKILMFSSIHLSDGEECGALIAFCDNSVLWATFCTQIISISRDAQGASRQ